MAQKNASRLIYKLFTIKNMRNCRTLHIPSACPSPFSSKYPPTPPPYYPVRRRNRSFVTIRLSARKASSAEEGEDEEHTYESPSNTLDEEEKEEDKDKPSLAASTGELFLGVAALLRNSRRNISLPVVKIPDLNLGFLRRFRGGGGDDEEIANVTKDDLDPSVEWEQREKDVKAERERDKVTSPGFSFSAAGFLFPYHLGVAQCLRDKGYILENTPLAGSSAGAIVSAVIASGIDLHTCLEITKELSEDCRSNGTAFRVGELLRGFLHKCLPDDVHLRANGRIRVAITQVFRSPRALLVDHFDSKEDLISALFTSSFIPGYLAPRPATVFRNRICVDGGLTLFMPPTVAPNTVRVCAFPLSQLGLKGIGISPDCNPGVRASARQLINWALEPASDDMLDSLFEFGYKDANTWTLQNPVEEILKPDILVEVP